MTKSQKCERKENFFDNQKRGEEKIMEVMILMGSDSDKKIMTPAKKILDDLGIDSEMRITSAHRTPERTPKIVFEAIAVGCQVFICGAGMAAHLAGVVASYVTRPVIGVPLTSGISPLGGVDALLATVQMPPGMPVATVGINMAENAAILAAQILALNNPALVDKVFAIRKKAAAKVEEADVKLQNELANPAKEETK